MRNIIKKLIVASTFGLLLSGSAMAIEGDVDGFGFEANRSNNTNVYVTKASYQQFSNDARSPADVCYLTND